MLNYSPMPSTKTDILWTPSKETRDLCQMSSFIHHVNQHYSLFLKTYEELYQWSITHIENFWASVWTFCDIKASQPYTKVASSLDMKPGVNWFVGSKLNFAEHCLKTRSSHPALLVKTETGPLETVSYDDLAKQVSQVQQFLKSQDIKKGDRVAGYLSNGKEAIITMLACTSLGAIWTACSPDFGTEGTLDRFSQIEPSILIATTHYTDNGKWMDQSQKISDIASQLKTLKALVLTSHSASIQTTLPTFSFNDILDTYTPTPLTFEQIDFNDPLYILYSSGTTGKPKSIVHRVGGTLIQHLKEHRLHCDLKPSDRLFYVTSCGWMLWNWMVSGLASGCTLVLYEGSPFYPNPNTLWQLIDETKTTVFGTSARYISALLKLEAIHLDIKYKNRHGSKPL